MARPTLHAGDTGTYVKAMQRGLKRALGPASENLTNGAYGSRTIRDVARFKRAHRIYADGSIFGQTAWKALQPYLSVADKALTAVLPTPTISPEEKARKRIMAEGLWLVANARYFTYAQIRPYPVPPNLRDLTDRKRWDCSSTVTACYHAGGAPDPNGRSYNGSGNTWAQVARGRWTSSPKPGDICFYGPAASNPTHEALYIGGGEVVSFGSTPPRRLPMRYRRDYLGTKTYDVL